MKEAAKFLLFRKHPTRVGEDYVTSAMQGFETSILLIALRRFPVALSAIGSALESALQASGVGRTERDGLQILLTKASHKSSRLRLWNVDDLKAFRDLRNKFVHRGFSPRDDNPSIRAIVATGLPLLELVFEEFLDFSISDGLLMEYAEHLRVAKAVLGEADSRGQQGEGYCLNALGASIRWSLKDSFQSSGEWSAIESADTDGYRFEMTQRLRDLLESKCECPCNCDCPVCCEYNTAVADLDTLLLQRQEVVPVRYSCTNCGFATALDERILAEELLRETLLVHKDAVLQGYDIKS
jgi:hypothetical protein